jgi:PLP dependent protein
VPAPRSRLRQGTICDGQLPAQDDDLATLTRARARVLERIAHACERAGREPATVALIAVAKTVDAARVAAAVAAGFSTIGENRVQEAEAKAGQVAGATWHLIGPLQSNKARRAVGLFDMIQTVDSVELARRLDRLAGEVRPGRPLPVLLEANVDRDPAKAGFEPDDVRRATGDLAGMPNLDVRGLMTIGRLAASESETRATFRALRGLGEDLRGHWPDMGPELSMGMTDDYEVAVEEGATIVRIGRAIFGERPHEHAHEHGHDEAAGHHDG